ncbi:hypothetical protein A3J19_04900 [Candidatus Daviesbacteria bacterium RIFCSPLOWO2_02_FULL_41_8]|uniref:Uncharacterized protein n=3 Tax=Candidatus Daviesiibacteriota TaxID=1752718 RepID=A0A1F5NHD5_9BACT|nr:MAG: hypothetical protein A2871_02635 [Candidatus Daviesbacteria bacterium RIFCSPHIGHO2_01_FULL_41_23]OGE33806.1 MAG: hypothetical protein A3D83_04510 [Candidatus Daviesbacteria bacterium RIFCSPHIGHO2_02_FULL_41_10]OGE62073.1 MAG: hypothetical protein A2967_00250 [Candidatus Daviesbacteria bacterium RIFCSPLOWO2_01_FULL_41_32]OGE77038.1 MAG: hypothetical protein A3J19_04900 [Candidatus Daviesbacteria bacterium RIFCSPLOWO2_02_FULL_41_8]
MVDIKYFGIRNTEFDSSVLLSQATDPCLSIINQGEFVENPDKIYSTWTISDIDGRDKWTEECDSCIASVVLGLSVTGQRLALLAHIGPGSYYNGSDFRKSYPDLLSDFARETLN